MVSPVLRSKLFLSSNVGDFIRLVRQVQQLAELRTLLEAFSSELGCEHFAVVHHADLGRLRPGQILLQNYPESWAECFIREAFFLLDPIHQACARTHVAFAWGDTGSLIRVTPTHRQIFELAGKHGLRDGVSVPCNIPGEWRGSCSFVARRQLSYLDEILPAMQLAGMFAFQAARRISGYPADPLASATQLSRRQRECILLAAQGKSDTDIGTILSLSPVTVRHYLDAARQRFDLATRQQLVIAALASGEISFIELQK